MSNVQERAEMGSFSERAFKKFARDVFDMMDGREPLNELPFDTFYENLCRRHDEVKKFTIQQVSAAQFFSISFS